MKKYILVLLACLLPSFVFAESEEEIKFEFYSVTDFAYYPKADFVSGGNHFAPITGAYDGVELQETIKADCIIPVPFSDNFLFKDNTLVLEGALSLTPVSVTPKAKISFTPVAFLNFSAGASISAAWEFLGIKSLACYDPSKKEYVQQPAFETYRYHAWLCSTFMFDLAAVWPGEWHHIVAVASWELNYQGLVNARDNDELFKFHSDGGLFKGVGYESNYVIGYQMPSRLSLVGVKAQFIGFLDDKLSDSACYSKFDGDFMIVNLGCIANYDFDEKNLIVMLMEFGSRRSYVEDCDGYEDEPMLSKNGREWYFKRIAFSYTHKF